MGPGKPDVAHEAIQSAEYGFVRLRSLAATLSLNST